MSLDPRGFKLENIRKLDEEEKLEYGDSDDDEFRVSLPLKKRKPKRVRNYKNKMENWENAEVCNAGLSGVTSAASGNRSLNHNLEWLLYFIMCLS